MGPLKNKSERKDGVPSVTFGERDNRQKSGNIINADRWKKSRTNQRGDGVGYRTQKGATCSACKKRETQKEQKDQ